MRIIGLNINTDKNVMKENSTLIENSKIESIMYIKYNAKIVSIRLWNEEYDDYIHFMPIIYGRCKVTYIANWSQDLEDKLKECLMYIPKNELMISDNYKLQRINNLSIYKSIDVKRLSLLVNYKEICYVTYDGGDKECPCGGYSIDMKYFIKNEKCIIDNSLLDAYINLLI